MITKTETLGQIASRQAVITKPLAELIAQHGADAMATSYTKATPFGSYLIHVEIAA